MATAERVFGGMTTTDVDRGRTYPWPRPCAPHVRGLNRVLARLGMTDEVPSAVLQTIEAPADGVPS